MKYVDTSVLVAYYTPESRSSEATEILREGVLALGDITIAEFYVAIARKEREGLLSPDAVFAVRELFEKHLLEGRFQRIPFHSGHVVALRDFVSTVPVSLRTLDALYCAAALETEAEMVTFDRRLTDGARALGIPLVTTGPG